MRTPQRTETIEQIGKLPDGRFLFMPHNPPLTSEMVAKTDELKLLVEYIDRLEAQVESLMEFNSIG